MKTILTALLLSAGLAKAAEVPNDWQVNERGYAVREAEETQDFVGINICEAIIMFASPAENRDEGTEAKVKITMRVDTEVPWDGEITLRVTDGLVLGGLGLDPVLLRELIAGQNLRVKWSETVYSRFDLSGLTETLKTVKCDSEFFGPEPKSGDSKFFS